MQGLHFGEQKVTGEMILESHGAVVFVIDAQDKPYHYPVQNFIDTVRTVRGFNEAFEFEVSPPKLSSATLSSFKKLAYTVSNLYRFLCIKSMVTSFYQMKQKARFCVTSKNRFASCIPRSFFEFLNLISNR
jgi:hypothetical protein